MLVRRIARPMLGSMFVIGGIDSARNPEGKSAVAEDVVRVLRDRGGLPLPEDTTAVVRLDGAVKAVAGLALSLGRFPRPAALVLGASLVPTTLAAHRFWELDGDQRAMQQIQFFKNLSMLGGLLLAAVDTEGKPSLGWRTRRAASRVQRNVSGAAHTSAGAVESAAGTVTDSVEDVARRARKSLPV